MPAGDEGGRSAVDLVNRYLVAHHLRRAFGSPPSDSDIEAYLRQHPLLRDGDDLTTALAGHLSERQAGILRLRAGVAGEPACTPREVALLFGVSQSRIRQIEDQIVARLMFVASQGWPVRATGKAETQAENDVAIAEDYE